MYPPQKDPNLLGLEEVVLELNKLLDARFKHDPPISAGDFEELFEESLGTVWLRWIADDPDLPKRVTRDIDQADKQANRASLAARETLRDASEKAQKVLEHAEYLNRLSTDHIDWPGTTSPLSISPNSEHIGGTALYQLMAVGTHARLLAVCNDIIFLCEFGRLDSARARARTLCEIAIIQWSLAIDRPNLFEITERYYVWSQCELGAAADHDLMARAENAWGPNFFQSLSWAAPLVTSKRNSKITLYKLATAIGREDVFAHYKVFNHDIHAGSAKLISETDFTSRYPFSTRPTLPPVYCARLLHLTVILIQDSCSVLLRALAQVTQDYTGFPYLGLMKKLTTDAITAALNVPNSHEFRTS